VIVENRELNAEIVLHLQNRVNMDQGTNFKKSPAGDFDYDRVKVTLSSAVPIRVLRRSYSRRWGTPVRCSMLVRVLVRMNLKTVM
jgi:hypothetical protein